MTKQVQRRRGTASQHTSFTGADGELSVNTTNKSVHVHDGVTTGGIEAARADLTNVSDASLNTALAGNTLSSLTITSTDINGGTIDGTTIGSTSPAAITGTALTATTSATLQHSASTKLATTSTGVDVTGTVTADGLTIDSNSGDIELQWAAGSTHKVGSSYSTAYFTGMRVTESSRNTDIISLDASGIGNINLFTGTAETKRMSVDPSGDISFYEDTGTTPKFFWDASAEALGLGTSSPAAKLDLGTSVDATKLLVYGSGNVKYGFGIQTDTLRYFVPTGSAVHSFGSVSTADGTTYTERMRIDASGNVLVGTTTTTPNTVAGAVLRASGIVFSSVDGGGSVFNRLTSDGDIVQFRKDGTVVGSVSVTASATTYNTSSDYRLKEDVQPMIGASDRLLQLKPINFAWKADGSRTDGFLAHELQEVIPAAAHGTKDEVDADGKPVYQGIDQSKIVPLLTAALQEALNKIDALEARIVTLETKL